MEQKLYGLFNQMLEICDTYNVSIHGRYELVESKDFEDYNVRRVSTGFAYQPK